MEEISRKAHLQTGRVGGFPSNNGDLYSKHINETDDDKEPELQSIFSNGNKVLMLALLVLGAAVALPRVFSPTMVGDVRTGAPKTEVCCGVRLPSDFMSLVVLLCQSLSTTIMNSKNMTEVNNTSTSTLSFLDCHKLVLAECGLDITNTEQLGHLTRCVEKGGMALIMEETYPVILMLEVMSRKRMETMKMIPCHHLQERPRLSPSANFNNLAMKERGRMGAHPASHPITGEEGGRTTRPTPGVSRMPPIPMKLNKNMGAPGVQPPQNKVGGSTLALITPVYAIGIITFFVYTLSKIFFKNKDIEEDEEEEDLNDSTYATDIKWDDLKLRISKIGEVVESVAEREENLIAGDEIDEELSKNNVKIITSFVDIEDKKSDAEDFKDKKSMVKEGGLGTGSESGRIEKCKVDEADDFLYGSDPRDLEISLLKARLEETEKAMERIVAQMGIVTSRLAPHVIAQALEGVNFDQDNTSEKSKHENCIKDHEAGVMNIDDIHSGLGESESN